MIRNERTTFCGLRHTVARGAQTVYIACPDPGCFEHAHSVTCPTCKARPVEWDYMVQRLAAAR